MSQDDKKQQLGKIALKRTLVPAAGSIRPGKVDEIPSTMPARGNGSLKSLSEEYGVPAVDLGKIEIDLSCLEHVPQEVAKASRIFPFSVTSDRLLLAMANPSDKKVIDEIEFVSGHRVFPHVADASTLEQTITDAYAAKATGATLFGKAESGEMTASLPPGLVVGDAVEKAGRESEFSTTEFGEMNDEVSALFPAFPDLTKQPSRAPGEGQKSILVIDDDKDIRLLIARLLAGQGYHVLETESALHALRLLKDHLPDLIVLDAMLPELHGFDFAKRIRGSEKYGSIPIIMISAVYRGWRIAEDVKTNYGIEAYLEKPFKVAELAGLVSQLLSKQSPPQRDIEEISAEATKLLNDGIAAYQGGDIAKSVELLQKGVALDPLAYRLRYHLALLYGKNGQIYEGISQLERAVELNPKHFQALKNLAVLYERAGFKNKAVEMWERCVRTAPDSDTRDSVKEHLLTLL